MNWIPLERIDQLQEIKDATGYSILFKHSTRCAISMMAKRKFESEWASLPSETPVYFLDLLNHRDISAAIVQLFQVHHESPQLLLIRDGECIYHTSHGEVSADEASAQMRF
ncbi:bacillithiol system protein YtxJ [Arcticibacter tournemirensis]|uniref:Bacillithiol system redox-active protein YtxJ n=1 Tax=Arcticibacter tournemirensis TaxID=699437 RepID=A0A4V1KHP2_9SPHI|nr:bacillithiol system redox-active protein YtxJ [Arcticibacter tournemirensis]KAA8485921.1 bacillithiol system redox-active protein YtxJ [Arcticibacter tournemirensis]RXF67882.1 bacillithiol system redox-active protein YtxJ [Arcticibacter tournemirensis]TQM46821.1 bacillithiol system protein YtxJ [Arcticibacter tournemirensis]